jgi:hypothetical protein
METLRRLLSDPTTAAIAFGSSLALFVICLIAAPIVIARLPADYFVRPPGPARPTRHPLLRAARRTLQNLVGAALLVAGVAMLVLPGQGVLTILAALSLLEFPGKRKLQRRMLGLPGVTRVANAIRRRSGAPPLQLVPHSAVDSAHAERDRRAT